MLKGKNINYYSKKAQNIVLNKMQAEKANGLLKIGSFTTEIVWGNNSFIFPQQSKRKQANFRKGMFLFGMVRKDAKKYLENNKKIVLPRKYPVVMYEDDIVMDFFDNITATDINHAYWRIAFNLGVISSATYERGLGDNLKTIRLAALSTLGATKKYLRIVKGVVTKEVAVFGGDEDLSIVYKLIRLTCYKYMYKLKTLLKKDFICYKTDCIYYVKSKENIAMVRKFLKENNLTFKQLHEYKKK